MTDQSQLAFDDTISLNLTTLTNTNAETLDGTIHGLLYVPEIPASSQCAEDQYDSSIGLPRNVTTRSDLPPANYKLIALAPWFSKNCTRAYLKAARYDPVRAFIFYRPNNSTNKPQPVDEPIWDLDDGGAWVNDNKFPIFAIPGRDGKRMASKLAQYSGPVDTVPFGEEILDAFGPNPRDYIRIWTELTMEDTNDMPALWTFFVIVIGALLVIVAFVSLFMHLVQRQRRKSLAERVKRGEVDLEAMAIARVTVPPEHVKSFPLYTYQSESERSSCPATPSSYRGSSRNGDRSISSVMSVSGRSRSSLAGSEYSTAATNYQPQCQICLEDFINRVSVIRQLPCFHIYHPECIDEFLTRNSSLCPICQQCMLPRGYCPTITNAMVRRERRQRQLRSTVDVEADSNHGKKSRFLSRLSLHDLLPHSHHSSEIPLTPVKSGKQAKEAPSPASSQAPSQTPPQAPSQTRSPAPPTTSVRTTTATPTIEEAPSESTEPGPTSSEPITPPQPIRQSSRQPLVPENAPAAESEDTVAALPKTQRRGKRRNRPRHLKLQPPPTNGAPNGESRGGRKEPSDLARARMKHLAGPLDDDDAASPLCKFHSLSPPHSSYPHHWDGIDHCSDLALSCREKGFGQSFSELVIVGRGFVFD